jgi:hypothetical protein
MDPEIAALEGKLSKARQVRQAIDRQLTRRKSRRSVGQILLFNAPGSMMILGGVVDVTSRMNVLTEL